MFGENCESVQIRITKTMNAITHLIKVLLTLSQNDIKCENISKKLRTFKNKSPNIYHFLAQILGHSLHRHSAAMGGHYVWSSKTARIERCTGTAKPKSAAIVSTSAIPPKRRAGRFPTHAMSPPLTLLILLSLASNATQPLRAVSLPSLYGTTTSDISPASRNLQN